MQTHLKGFGLENFRVFKDYTWFDFAPITILTGPNSSGKSSLNKALLLLKDNFEKGNLPSGSLKFDSKAHGLNSASNVKYQYSDSQIMSFVFPHQVFIENTDNEHIENNNIDNLRESALGRLKKHAFLRPKIIQLYYHLSFQIKNNKALSFTHMELRNSDDNCILKVSETNLCFDVELFNEISKNNVLTPGLNFPIHYTKSISDPNGVRLDDWLHENDIESDRCIELRNQIYTVLGISYVKSIWDKHLGWKGESQYQKLYVPSTIEPLESVTILSQNRTEQKRVYSNDTNSSFISTLRVLSEANEEGIKYHKFINRCLKLLGIDGEIKVDFDDEKQLYFPNINGKSFLDYGFGYTQIASLIFKITEISINKWVSDPGIFSYEPTILILEEPESNLHPKFQSVLADILVDAAERFDIQFIVETHSEYLIRKLQYLTATKKVKPEDSVIYYFHELGKVPIGEKQVKKIEIQEDGSLSDEFGSGFFDEAANWELELLRLKNNKARNN